MRNNSGAVLLILLSVAWAFSLIGCAHLKLELENSSVQKPSNVALYFSVEKNDKTPIAGLAAESFKIYEDGQLISTFESKQTILNPEVAVVHYSILLLDLSGSITESGTLPQLTSAASAYAERLTKYQQMAIYGFDGSPRLQPIVGFTSDVGFIQNGLNWLANKKKSDDPSTNLNGAVVEATKLLEKQISASKQPLRFGTLVIFTDGRDRAHRISEEEVSKTLDQSKINVFAIGLGPELQEGELSRFARNGLVRAQANSNLSAAFEEVATRIEANSRKFYLLSYCSPSRAGTHKLRIEAAAQGQTGYLEHDFNADGFGPNCDPNKRPQFKIGKINLQ